MAKKLGWSKKERAAQEKEAYAYLGEFGGPVPDLTLTLTLTLTLL